MDGKNGKREMTLRVVHYNLWTVCVSYLFVFLFPFHFSLSHTESNKEINFKQFLGFSKHSLDSLH